MIATITGSIIFKENDAVIIDVQGIGYRVFVAQPQLLPEDLPIRFFTYHQIKEESQTLFGFQQQEAYDLFLKLISVKGIAGKTAMNILGSTDLEQLYNAILMQDVGFLRKLPGVGPKSASQIILDLKGKLVSVPVVSEQPQNPYALDAMEGLKSLGYKVSEIQGIKKELLAYEGTNSNDYLRYALGLMLKRKG